jgi:hypothetical protein
MNLTTNPVQTLSDCFGHAQNGGFSLIKYKTKDWKKSNKSGKDIFLDKERYPTTNDIEVFAMFIQTWGSTALGHGGIGGASMTSAYTVVLYCQEVKEFLVYFNGVFCYKVPSNSKNIHIFLEDAKTHNMADKHSSRKYYDNHN